MAVSWKFEYNQLLRSIQHNVYFYSILPFDKHLFYSSVIFVIADKMGGWSKISYLNKMEGVNVK